jgi:hypothetical protein
MASLRLHNSWFVLAAYYAHFDTYCLQLGNRTRKEHDPPFRYDTARTLRFFTFGFALGACDAFGDFIVLLKQAL